MTSCEHLQSVHLTLSKASVIPVIGTIPAAVKTLLAVIEVVVSAFFSIIFFALSACIESCKERRDDSLSHVCTGVKRTIVGVGLCIPFVGTVIVIGAGGVQSLEKMSFKNWCPRSEKFVLG